MITADGINKIEQFFIEEIDKAQFVIGTTAYDAASTEVELVTEEDRLMVIATSGNDLPVGETITKMRILAKDATVLAEDETSLIRTSQADGLYYGFRISITQQGE
jgi:hypothetical protein